MSQTTKVNYSQVALRMEFTPEIAPKLTYETLRMLWPSERPIEPLEDRKAKVGPGVIAKPPGQVTEISKGGYSLKAELQWDKSLYNAVYVSLLA